MEESAVWWDHQQHHLRVEAGIPDSRLLQQYVLPRPGVSLEPVACMSPDGTTLDRMACDMVMVSNSVTCEASLGAALAADATRYLPRDIGNRFCAVSAARWDCVLGPLTLPNLQSQVFMLALCSPISTVLRYTVCKILSKTIVQRCMTRKFGSVCLEDFRVEKKRGQIVYDGTNVMLMVRQLLLCSLLGNYDHCTPDSRPVREVRDFLYARLFDPLDRTHVEWFYNFFRHCSHLVVFALRDYLVFAMRDNPSMASHFSSLTNLAEGPESFAAVTVEAMDTARRFIGANAPLLATSDSGLDLFQQLSQLIAPFHERILKLSYKRMNPSILPNLVAVRKALPMRPIPGLVLPATPVPVATEDDPLGLDLNDDESDTDEPVVFDIRSYIKKPQLDALQQIVSRVVPQQHGVLIKCVSFFTHFGTPWSNVRYLYRVLQDIHQGSVSPKEEVYWLKKLYQKDPHTYTLLQVTTELVKEAQGIRIAATLPSHYWLNQLEAARSRFGLQNTRYVVATTMYFCFCTVCDTVYSLVSEFNSVYKQQYLFGLRSAVVEYETDKLYCRRDKQNHRGRCRDQELQQVPILGKILQFNNKFIMLCPQRGCGMCMVFDPKQCGFTSRGPACAACTKRIKARYSKPINFNSTELVLNCLMCGTAPTRRLTPHNTYMYPEGVLLCSKHHFNAMQRHVEKSYQPGMGHQQVADLMVKFVTEWRERARENNKTYNDWRIRQYKNALANNGVMRR